MSKHPFTFSLPRNFVRIRESQASCCRFALSANVFKVVSFFDCETGHIIDLEQMKRQLEYLPKKEYDVLKKFLEEYKTEEDCIKYWAKTIVHYQMGRESKNCYTRDLSQQILKEDGDQVIKIPSKIEDSFRKPDSFVKVNGTRLSYGFISPSSSLQFFDGISGKMCNLESLHEVLGILPTEERLLFWNYVITKDLYLKLLKDPNIKCLPIYVRKHVSSTYNIQR